MRFINTLLKILLVSAMLTMGTAFGESYINQTTYDADMTAISEEFQLNVDQMNNMQAQIDAINASRSAAPATGTGLVDLAASLLGGAKNATANATASVINPGTPASTTPESGVNVVGSEDVVINVYSAGEEVKPFNVLNSKNVKGNAQFGEGNPTNMRAGEESAPTIMGDAITAPGTGTQPSYNPAPLVSPYQGGMNETSEYSEESGIFQARFQAHRTGSNDEVFVADPNGSLYGPARKSFGQVVPVGPLYRIPGL